MLLARASLRALAIGMVVAVGCSERALSIPEGDLRAVEVHDLKAPDLAAAVAVSDLAVSDLAVSDLGAPDLADAASSVDAAFLDVDFGAPCHGDGGEVLWARHFLGAENFSTNLWGAGDGVLVLGVGFGEVDFEGATLGDPSWTAPYAFDVAFDSSGRPSRPASRDPEWVVPDGRGGRTVGETAPDGGFVLSDETADGQPAWARGLGSGNLHLAVAKVDFAGNLLIAGHAHGALDFGLGPVTSGGSFFVVAKLDPLGTPLWVHSYPLEQPEYPSAFQSIGSDGAGGLVVATSVTAPGGIGGAPVVGPSMVIARYDADGNFAWMKSFDTAYACVVAGGFDDTLAYSCLDSSGGVYQLTVEKLDLDGNALWTREFDGFAQPNGLVIDHQGDVVWAGELRGGPIDFGDGPINLSRAAGFHGEAIVKLDGQDGRLRWSRAIADVNAPNIGISSWEPSQVAVDDSDAVYVTGWFHSEVYLCGPRFTSTQRLETYLIKLAP